MNTVDQLVRAQAWQQACIEACAHKRFRCIIFSDLHLGSVTSHADDLVKLISELDVDYIYFAGDIFDCWKMGVDHLKNPESILGKIKKNCGKKELHLAEDLFFTTSKKSKRIFIPGNHDEVFRNHIGTQLGNAEICAEGNHTTKNGKNIRIIHGDIFDDVIRTHHFLSLLGTHGYEWMTQVSFMFDELRQNTKVSSFFEKLGLSPQWSLAKAIKKQFDKRTYTRAFEEMMVHHLIKLNKLENIDILAAGHTHIAMSFVLNKLAILNAGCWTSPAKKKKTSADDEIGTAIAEYDNGTVGHVKLTNNGKLVPFMPSFPPLLSATMH